jgi:hypothetical protein
MVTIDCMNGYDLGPELIGSGDSVEDWVKQLQLD